MREFPGSPGTRPPCRLGYGEGNAYRHGYAGHAVEQEYRPTRFSGRSYYEPSGEGEGEGSGRPHDET